jgi:DNA-binding response OmpR family regulator
MRILIIHNDKSVAHAINRELDETIYKIRHAGNGDEGLEMSLKMQFDLIVINWSLPKKNGISLLENIREHDIKTPVLMLVADESMRDSILGLDSDVNVIVSKSLDIREVATKMKSIRQIVKLNPYVDYGTLQGEMVET